jgi:hypothetical protein
VPPKAGAAPVQRRRQRHLVAPSTAQPGPARHVAPPRQALPAQERLGSGTIEHKQRRCAPQKRQQSFPAALLALRGRKLRLSRLLRRQIHGAKPVKPITKYPCCMTIDTASDANSPKQQKCTHTPDNKIQKWFVLHKVHVQNALHPSFDGGPAPRQTLKNTDFFPPAGLQLHRQSILGGRLPPLFPRNSRLFLDAIVHVA